MGLLYKRALKECRAEMNTPKKLSLDGTNPADKYVSPPREACGASGACRSLLQVTTQPVCARWRRRQLRGGVHRRIRFRRESNTEAHRFSAHSPPHAVPAQSALVWRSPDTETRCDWHLFFSVMLVSHIPLTHDIQTRSISVSYYHPVSHS